jgi:putative ABC transport system ATP-binding protein
MIQFENITKVYKTGANEVRAVDGISFEIKKGDFAALMGPSGSGKSTAMNIIGCLDHPTKGRYFLDGRDVSALSENALAGVRNRLVGFVHQNFNLLPRLTALENVELPLAYSGKKKNVRLERAKHCLSLLGLSDREHHLPIQLSGGQQQRVAIARALVNDAPVILADEPTGNLDSRTSIEIMNILERLNQRGATVLLVTHEPDIAEYAHYVLYFKDGRLGQ